MKKMNYLFVTILFFMSFLGFSQKKEVAVVAFYADKNIDLSDVGLSGAAIISELANDSSFNLQPILEKFHTKFFDEYAKKFPFEISPEQIVLTNSEYQNFEPEFDTRVGKNQYAVIDGYHAVNSHYGKNNIKNLSKIFADKDGIMFVYITFSFQKGFGVGGTATTKMQAYTNIVLYNKKGEKVFSINESANSKKTGAMVGGVPVMKVDKVLPMCESALEELMKDLDKKLQKIIDKSAKKL